MPSATKGPGRFDSLLLFALGLAFFLPALASRDLWQPLETRYATIGREMAETGDWLIPKINGEPYQDKPPLFFWLAAAMWKLGAGPQGVRVVSALAAAGTMVVLAALARLWFSRRAALLGAAILATTPEFGWLGRFGELDVTLTFFTTLAAYGWFAGGRRVALFYLGIGLAVMVKGPPGVLVPVVAAVAGRIARVAPSSPRAPFHPFWGLLIAALPAACWFVPAILRAGPSYAYALIVHHLGGRVVNSWQHRQPFYFYPNEAFWNFLPWLVLAIPASIRAWRRRRDEPASAMLLFWFLLGLLAFSAVSGKRVVYILPLAPPFALLVARGIEALLVERDVPERRTAAVLLGTLTVLWGAGVVILLLGICLVIAPSSHHPRDAEMWRPLAGIPWRAPVIFGGAVLAAVSLRGASWVRRGRHLLASWTAVAALAFGFLAHDFAYVIRTDILKSPRRIAEQLDRLVPPGEGEVGLYPARPAGELGEEQYAFSGAFNVYSKRLYLTPLHSPPELIKFLAAPGRRLVLSGWRAAEELGDLPPGMHMATVWRTGQSSMKLLANFPLED